MPDLAGIVDFTFKEEVMLPRIGDIEYMFDVDD